MRRRDPPLPPALALVAEPLGRRLRLAAFVGGVACVGLVFAAMLMPVEVVVEFPGEIVQHPSPLTLKAPAQGPVTHLWVEAGARVCAGAALVAVGTAGIEAFLAELDSERREQTARLRAAAALLAGGPLSVAAVPPPAVETAAFERWRRTERARVEAELKRLGQEYEARATERVAALARAETEKEIVAAALTERARIERLTRLGTASKSAAEAARIRVAEARRKLEGSMGQARVLQARLGSIAAAKAEVRAAAAQRWADAYVEALVALEKARARQARARAELKARTVTAPYPAEVDHIESIGKGQFVAAGAPLLRIVPRAPGYRVSALIPPRDRRRVGIGDRVRVLTGAATEDSPGWFEGRVVALAAAPTERRDRPRGYEVEIAFDEGVRSLSQTLVAGRPVTVVAIAGRRRLGSYLLAPAFELRRRAAALP